MAPAPPISSWLPGGAEIAAGTAVGVVPRLASWHASPLGDQRTSTLSPSAIRSTVMAPAAIPMTNL